MGKIIPDIRGALIHEHGMPVHHPLIIPFILKIMGQGRIENREGDAQKKYRYDNPNPRLPGQGSEKTIFSRYLSDHTHKHTILLFLSFVRIVIYKIYFTGCT